MYRTKYCQEISSADVGERVNVCGWVQKQRDLGTLIFIDLRDRSGIVQLAFDADTDKEVFRSFMNDKEAREKLLSSPEVKSLIAQLFGKR